VKGATNEIPVSKETRIIFCSRTHSQLTQFVKELRRVRPPPSFISLSEKEVDKGMPRDDEIVKHLCLGSRKNLCINPKVSRLGSVAAINEKCLDLQKPGVADEQKCPFIPKKDNPDLAESFRDHALAEIHDIEDLGHLGQSCH
jgi:chromosome transmission fidelity protein 1